MEGHVGAWNVLRVVGCVELPKRRSEVRRFMFASFMRGGSGW